MKNIKWLRAVDVLGAHRKLIEFSGGSDGVRDQGLLESALARPLNIAAYEPDAPLTRLAAAYGYGIAKNHPFVDGNKRAAFIAIELFLDLHGIAISADEDEKYAMMIRLAASEMSEEELADWLTSRSAQSRADLPTLKSGGVRPGVDLTNDAAIYEILDEDEAANDDAT